MSLYWQWQDQWILRNATSVWEQTEPEKQTKSKLAQEQHILFSCQNQTLTENARNTYEFIAILLLERETRKEKPHNLFIYFFNQQVHMFCKGYWQFLHLLLSLILDLLCLPFNS